MRSHRITVTTFFALMFAAMIPLHHCRGDLIIDIQEVAGNVEVNYNGTLDLTGLSFNASSFPAVDRRRFLTSNGGTFQNVPANQSNRSYATPFSSTPAAGWISSDQNADSGSGTGITLRPDLLVLETSAFSGNTWTGSGTQVFNSTTIAGLGLDLSAPRIFTLNNLAANRITVLQAVPEPGSLILFALGGCGLAARRWYRRKQAIVTDQQT